jgi:hypothetical protein
MFDRQFPGGLCSLMIDFQATVDNPIIYLVKKVLPKLVKKYLGIRKN